MKKVTSRASKKRTRAETADDYLASVPKDGRAALTKLRKTIKAAAPEATEVISYEIPTFKHHGPLVAFAVFKDYDLGKACIRFPADKPLPTALVTKLVKARIAENETGGND